MPTVKPFKAIRPAPDKAAFVASKSYEDYDERELNAVLEYNPFSFLHIINPGFKFHKDTTGQERFKLVRNRYLEFLEESVFIKDEEPCFYLYQLQQGDFSSLGLFCTTSIQDYQKDKIKKHEAVLQKRVELFTEYLSTVGFNAEPVLMTYKDDGTISSLLQEQMQRAFDYDFTTTDKIRHTLWRIDDPETIQSLEKKFLEQDVFYIADGHHRSASSNLLTNTKKGNNQNYFLSYLIPENEIKVSGFDRLITDLNGLTVEEFLVRLDEYFRIEEKKFVAFRPKIKHQFTMYLNGIFYLLHLRKTAYAFTDELSKLDTQILFKTILEPILEIKDLTNDRRIGYSQGKPSLLELKDNVDNGKYKVGFSTTPITIEEIKAIADAGLVMPPKSTYIEPKLRSGLTIYEI
ncbi:hypothetical protein GCM10011414_15560 [Croceivirga lutea]|uniref:DUF1015 domain-containing protein n=1 Tax=Croceivirga lutea TaxID=1775167 RepID=UPI00163A1E87|nr:DUF1015 domain-containing protein [Croceivirga lutea]GGG46792.1 hypothetical protein GCM10011414_15560 [Croceivirga lutea]